MSKKFGCLAALALLTLASLFQPTQAQIPRTLNYQGYLTSPSGSAINSASLAMIFKIYTVQTGGSALHTETQTVTVSNGIFNVLLGTSAALTLPFDAQYYLGVTMGTDPEMTPRQPLAASPYAIRTASAESLAATATVAGSQITGAISTATLPATSLTGTIATAQIADASVTAAKLASSGCTGGQVLQYNGSAWVCTTPAATSGGTVTSITAGTGLTGGTITTTGTLGLGTVPVANGGTGQTSLTANGIVLGQGSGALATTAVGLSGQVLAGTAGAPTWTSAPTISGNVVVGATITQPFASRLQVVAPTAKTNATNIRGLSVTSNDASVPFALDVKIIGAPTLVDRGIVLQTTDWNSADGGNLLLQPQGGNVGVGTFTPSASRLTVAGRIESTSGGVKFPDGSVQTTAAGGAVPGTFQWQVVAGTTQQAQSNTGYVATNAATVTVTLPTAPNVGDTVRVSGAGGGGWRIAQNALQSVSGSYFGLTFIDQWLPRDSLREWSSVASSADGSKLVAAVSGPGGLLYTSTDYGASWAPRESVRNWQSVASSSDGSKLVAAAYLGQLYTSIDSGITWTQRDSVRQWRAVASSSDGSKLVAAEGGGGLIYTSIDFGQTWTPRPSGVRLWQSVASSADGTKLVAVTYNDNLYTSSDSGATWTARDGIRYWKAVASSADGSKLVAAAEGAGGQLFTSTNSGATWTPRETSRTWTSLASSADGSRLVAVAGSAQIYTSSDFGVGWTARETSRQWGAVASSADGIRVVAAVQGTPGPGGGGLIYTSVPAVNTYTASTTEGVTGYLTGLQRSAIELQYVGGGQFMPLSYVGTIGSF